MRMDPSVTTSVNRMHNAPGLFQITEVLRSHREGASADWQAEAPRMEVETGSRLLSAATFRAADLACLGESRLHDRRVAARVHAEADMPKIARAVGPIATYRTLLEADPVLADGASQRFRLAADLTEAAEVLSLVDANREIGREPLRDWMRRVSGKLRDPSAQFDEGDTALERVQNVLDRAARNHSHAVERCARAEAVARACEIDEGLAFELAVIVSACEPESGWTTAQRTRFLSMNGLSEDCLVSAFDPVEDIERALAP